MGRVFADFYDPLCEWYFPFWDYGAEQAMIYDISGNHHHGTIHGATHSAGQMGTHRCIGWYFNQSDVQHAEVNIGKLHTLHYWVQHNDILQTAHLHDKDAGVAYLVQLTDTTIGYNSNSVIVTANHGGFVTTSLPTLLSIVRNAKGVWFYQNGFLLGSDVMADNNDMILEYIGNSFTGNVFDVVCFLEAQTQVEIQNFYEKTRRKYGNL